MSSFRQYGGLNRAPTNNIVRNHYSNSDNPTISNYLGQYNSKIVSESHIDLSGNSMLNVHAIYFDNGFNIIDGSFNGDVTINGNLEVTKSTQLDGSLNVYGDVSLNSTLEVGGTATFNGQIVSNSDVSLNSTLEVGGVATFDASMVVYSTVNGIYINNGLPIDTYLKNFILNSITIPGLTGSDNTIFGYNVMPNATSAGTSCCVGHQAGFNITTGQSNTLIGAEAGYDISGGSFNTAIGYQAYYNQNYDYSTAIGAFSVPTGDHQIVLGTANETVIIDGSFNISGATTFNGQIVANADVSLNSTLEVGGNATFNGQIVVNADVLLNSTLEVAGDVLFDGSLNVAGTTTSLYFVSGSDYRIKTDVKQLTSAFTIDQLNPVTYTNKLSGKQDTGFIAHEMQEIFPHLVTGEKNGEETQTLNYQGLIAILTKEIQELKKRVEILENK